MFSDSLLLAIRKANHSGKGSIPDSSLHSSISGFLVYRIISSGLEYCQHCVYADADMYFKQLLTQFGTLDKLNLKNKLVTLTPPSLWKHFKIQLSQSFVVYLFWLSVVWFLAEHFKVYVILGLAVNVSPAGRLHMN